MNVLNSLVLKRTHCRPCSQMVAANTFTEHKVRICLVTACINNLLHRHSASSPVKRSCTPHWPYLPLPSSSSPLHQADERWRTDPQEWSTHPAGGCWGSAGRTESPLAKNYKGVITVKTPRQMKHLTRQNDYMVFFTAYLALWTQDNLKQKSYGYGLMDTTTVIL